VRTKAKLKAATTEYMQTLEASPERVKTYFQDPRVKYAAGYYLLAGSITKKLGANLAMPLLEWT